jgi:WD40 repeat protein
MHMLVFVLIVHCHLAYTRMHYTHSRYPLPPAPALFSRTGRLIFSGGHPSGAVLVWHVDAEVGSVIGEAAMYGHSAPVTCLATCNLEQTGTEILLSGSADCTAIIWCLRRLNSLRAFQTPRPDRLPQQVLRGHVTPITACAVDDSLSLALTCSRGSALLHCIEGQGLLHSIQQGLAECDITAAGLSSLGYAVIASTRALDAHSSTNSTNSSSSSGSASGSRLATYTVNGALVCELQYDLQHSAVITSLNVVGHGELVTLALTSPNVTADVAPRNLVEVRSVCDLALVWAMPSSTAQLMMTAVTPSHYSCSSQQQQQSLDVQCVEVGPSIDAPILLCCGMSDGGILLHALLDAEPWLKHQVTGAVGTIINAPVKIVQGTVQTAQNIVSIVHYVVY